MGGSLLKIKILNENCDPELANDTSLPYTSYLVQYCTENGVQWDIAVSSKKADIFDHYWDTYKNVQNMSQTQGKVNPKMWNDPSKKKKK